MCISPTLLQNLLYRFAFVFLALAFLGCCKSNFVDVADQKLTADDAGEKDRFGNSVSINGDYTIVGAPWNDDEDRGRDTVFNYNSGSAYIFKP